MIRVLPSHDGISIEPTTTTEELLEFLVKHQSILQGIVFHHEISERRTAEFARQKNDYENIVADAYNKLRSHLDAKATRLRHS